MKKSFKNIITSAVFFFFIFSSTVFSAVVIKDDAIGEYVRAADYVVYADLAVSSIKNDVIVGKLKVIESLKGDIGKKEIDVAINTLAPISYVKFKSDLTNLKIALSEAIESTGSSNNKVIAMLRKEGNGYEFLRIITFFRPDKIDVYLYSYKEIVSMTKITDPEKLLKTIRYNLGEEFTYSLYSHCIDELFNLNISFAELFSTVKEFLDSKEKKKSYVWFNILRKTGNRFEEVYDKVDEKGKDSFFDYIYGSLGDVQLDNEYINKQFLEFIYDFRRLIIRNDKWKKKYYDTVKDRKVVSLNEDRNKELEQLREKVLRSLSKE